MLRTKNHTSGNLWRYIDLEYLVENVTLLVS